MNIEELLDTCIEAEVEFSIEGDELFLLCDGELPEQLLSDIKNNKVAIKEYLQRSENVSNAEQEQIDRIERNADDYPVSYTQQRLWFIDQLEGQSAVYNMFTPVELVGRLSQEALENALNALISRHEVLRTTFRQDEGGEIRQILNSVRELKIETQDVSSLEIANQKTKIDQFISDEALKPFDLSQDLMLRVKLIKKAPQKHLLLFTMHHIACDGWSQGILINEFTELYSAYCENRDSRLAPLKIQYVDYVHWLREKLSGENLTKQLNYWSSQLADFPQTHSLPLDNVRPTQQSYQGASFYQSIDPKVCVALTHLCQRQDVTLFMLLESVFAWLVSSYSGTDDVVIGSPMAGRNHQDTEGLIGFFINNLSLRTQIDGDPTFKDFLHKNKQVILDAYSNQDLPFDMLVEELQPERSLSYNPVFQIVFGLNNTGSGDQSLALPDLELNALSSEFQPAKVDIELSVVEQNGEIHVAWIYSTDLFLEQTVKSFAETYARLLKEISVDLSLKLSEYPLLDDKSKNYLINELNQTDLTYETKPLISQFIQQAKVTPDAIALRCQEETLTYQALASQAERLAHY
ncbi:condensation domain-containing protein, partial [Pseudoalteromonas sp. P1-9]|uniref:condensation domain-containing protein n=1 Tax=Pseudoalteromonas sp. P1-9 TaxID=1710354 RepID=UPI000A6F9193